ncbi:MarR family transcriptional regulator [Lactobacillus sp. YT155]|uniref:MarR family winged helix-turn-helix transcriptional regulator n=1 Tax=Lactobacillus sp. YT155 TaxID=3060955 RepID=UPI00265DF1D1|nr:MarR family transcriptional regulator [Lactobacillus sp. YT155]MDO1604659.1 MarR family transcriptional regulator [Lactobacillus sp. YT155]
MMNDLGKLAQNISVLHRKFYKDMNVKYQKYHLNPTASCILLMVDDNPGIIQKEICDGLVIDKALATREINKMQDMDYIQKESGSGRTVKLTLGAEGKKVAPKIREIRKQWWAEKFATTGVDEDSQLVEGIQTVVKTITGE